MLTENLQHKLTVNKTHLSIYHVGDHHDLVTLCVWEFQWKFGGLNVKSQNNRVLKEHEKKSLWKMFWHW